MFSLILYPWVLRCLCFWYYWPFDNRYLGEFDLIFEFKGFIYPFSKTHQALTASADKPKIFLDHGLSFIITYHLIFCIFLVISTDDLTLLYFVF